MVARILEGDFEIEGTDAQMFYVAVTGKFRLLDPEKPSKGWWAWHPYE